MLAGLFEVSLKFNLRLSSLVKRTPKTFSNPWRLYSLAFCYVWLKCSGNLACRLFSIKLSTIVLQCPDIVFCIWPASHPAESLLIMTMSVRVRHWRLWLLCCCVFRFVLLHLVFALNLNWKRPVNIFIWSPILPTWVFIFFSHNHILSQ